MEVTDSDERNHIFTQERRVHCKFLVGRHYFLLFHILRTLQFAEYLFKYLPLVDILSVISFLILFIFFL